MLADVTTSRLNGAVHLCLQKCYRAENPIACLAEYVSDLRRMGWQEWEVEELEIAIRRILGRVLRPQPTRQPATEPATAASR